MKVTFVGTGIMSSTTRCNTSMLVDDLLFDAGAGTVKQLYRLGVFIPKAIRYVCISHFHVDHYLDVASLFFAREIDKSQKMTIIGRKGIRAKTVELMKFTHGDGNPDKYDNLEALNNVEFIEVEPGDTVELPDCKLHIVELMHNTCRPLGYILEKEGKRIGYCCDMNPFDAFGEICDRVDHMMSDCNNKEKGSVGHMGQDVLYQFAQEHPHCKFHAVHRGDYEPKYPDTIHYPVDGDVMEI